MNKLFEYAIIYHQLQTKEQRDAGEKQKSKLIVPPTFTLAAGEKEALVIANRAIPDEYVECVVQDRIAGTANNPTRRNHSAHPMGVLQG